MERLDKLIASQGTWSRKDVKDLIKKGLVTVNGSLEKNPETKVSDSHNIAVKGEPLNISQFLYIMLNKPAGYVSATKDPKDKTVMDLLPAEYKRNNLFPAGRLDKDTTGLLLITDDGNLAHDILSPKKHVDKTYLLKTDLPINNALPEKFLEGIELNDGICKPAVLEIIDDFNAKITLTEGKFHQIKRMFGCFGLKVVELKRISMGRLKLDENLPEGSCRLLKTEEIEQLKRP